MILSLKLIFKKNKIQYKMFKMIAENFGFNHVRNYNNLK